MERHSKLQQMVQDMQLEKAVMVRGLCRVGVRKILRCITHT